MNDVTQAIVASLGSEVRGFEDLFGLLASIKPAWHADALCREFPEVNFFTTNGAQSERARSLCARCLVADECLAWAMGEPASLPGVWGGTNPAGRRRLRRKGARAA